jgi:hypothetical protein
MENSPATPINLPVRDVLIAARREFDAGNLQIQKDRGMEVCLYSAPCAVGAALPEELRKKFDNMNAEDGFDGGPASIEGLVSMNFVTTDNDDDLIILQEMHDEGDVSSFEYTLVSMEKKYGLR